MHILPHWNWPDRVGQNVPVFVYTNGDSAELFLNGQSLGLRKKGVVPQGPPNYAGGRPATASSSEASHPPEHADDGNRESRWCASSADANQWWEVDLGEARNIRYLAIEFEREEKNYGYEVKISTDASSWRTIVTKDTSRNPRWGGPTQIFHDVDAQGRYIRIQFTATQDNCWASIREFAAYPEKAESDYYASTYTYRLRWNDVVYQPGELKAVAYKDGKQIGEAVMRTADAPAAIRLRPTARNWPPPARTSAISWSRPWTPKGRSARWPIISFVSRLRVPRRLRASATAIRSRSSRSRRTIASYSTARLC